jgi:hypothetical protein
MATRSSFPASKKSFSGRVGRGWGIEKFLGLGGLGGGHLDADAAGGEDVTFDVQRGGFAGDKRMKARRFQPRTGQLRVHGIKDS